MATYSVTTSTKATEANVSQNDQWHLSVKNNKNYHKFIASVMCSLITLIICWKTLSILGYVLTFYSANL